MKIIHNKSPDKNILLKIINRIMSHSPNLNIGNTQDKVDVFIKNKVEVIYIIEKDEIVASTFLYPSQIGKINFYWVFDLYSFNDKGEGVLIIKYAMEKFDHLCCIGITKKAKSIYELFKWRKIHNYYRYFKILNLKTFLFAYENRLTSLEKKFLNIFFKIHHITNFLNKFLFRRNSLSLHLNKNDLKISNSKIELPVIVSNKILRIIVTFPTKKINLLNISINSYVCLEFLSKKKINLIYSFLCGLIRVDSPIYYFSKNKVNYDQSFLENIDSFNKTDKSF
jgi:hypothetical protein